jgi:hypothetical protein
VVGGARAALLRLLRLLPGQGGGLLAGVEAQQGCLLLPARQAVRVQVLLEVRLQPATRCFR